MIRRFLDAVRFRTLREDARLLLESSHRNLADAQQVRAVAAATASQLHQAVARNHFREAVEFQFKGGST